jgi:hypothetical protein
MARNPIIGKHPANAPAPDKEVPRACYEGWVYMGYKSVGEDGVLIKVGTERGPCRRCHPESL